MSDEKQSRPKGAPKAAEPEREIPNLTRQQLEETHYARALAAGASEAEARQHARKRAREQCGE